MGQYFVPYEELLFLTVLSLACGFAIFIGSLRFDTLKNVSALELSFLIPVTALFFLTKGYDLNSEIVGKIKLLFLLFGYFGATRYILRLLR